MRNGILRPTATAFEGDVFVRSRDLYLPPRFAITAPPSFALSFDWRGAGYDSARFLANTGMDWGIDHFKDTWLPLPEPRFSSTHIASSQVIGTMPTFSGMASFDSLRTVATTLQSTVPAITPSGRLFGFDPLTDTIRTTTIQQTWFREITLPQLPSLSSLNTYRFYQSPSHQHIPPIQPLRIERDW